MLLFQEGENLLGKVQDRGWNAREAGDMDAVTLVGPSGRNPVQEDDLQLTSTATVLAAPSPAYAD